LKAGITNRRRHGRFWSIVDRFTYTQKDCNGNGYRKISMAPENSEQSSFASWVQEMSRRRVFRVLAIYVAVGWGFTEIVQGVIEQVSGPPAIATFTTIAFIVGFPIVLVLAWLFDVDRHGFHREPTRRKGQLLVALALAVMLSASYAIFRYMPRDTSDAGVKQPAEVVMAVLPFKNISADDAYDYLGNAIAEDLLNGAAVIPGLRVKATFSSFALEDAGYAAFAEQLGVNRLLEGTFRVKDDVLRVAARFIDTDSGDVVWTRVLTDSVSNIFQVEDQIAKDIASEFGLPHPSSVRDVSRQVEPRVYQLYLQAREGFRNPWQDTQNTVNKIRQILELEPNFPEALMMMGFLETGRAWLMEDRQSPWLKTGEEYTLRALETDPELSEAYAVLALNYGLQYRWRESRQMADKAIEVAGPRPLNVLYTFAYNNLGHRRQAIDILLQVFDQDPLNPLATQNLMSAYAELGEDEKALQWEQLAIESGIRYQRDYLIEVYARKGDTDTARQLAGLWAEEHGFGTEVGEHVLGAMTTGESEAFEEATDQKLADGSVPMGQVIWNYIVAGAEADKVFDIVEQAIPAGKFNQISMLWPGAARYRQDPRFLEIFTRLGLVDYWMSVELPDFCRDEVVAGLCE